MSENDVLLQVTGLGKSFRGLHALQNYELVLRSGELLGVIGPNGAGKTTLFNLLTGIVKPTAGAIYLGEIDITHRKPEQIARLGIARTFQKIRLFQPLSALENVRVAVQSGHEARVWSVLLGLPAFFRREDRIDQHARELLALLTLDQVADRPARQLSYSQQRRLEIACALALAPRLLLLDEPAAGMNPTETEDLMRLILRLHEQLGLTLILIEHNMHVIMRTCRRIQVLSYGEIIAEGDPEAIRAHPKVIEAYLGHGTQGTPSLGYSALARQHPAAT